MKRILIPSMILIAVLLLSGLGAAGFNSNTPFSIGIEATVGQYAEIRMEDTLLPIIEFVGNETGQKGTGSPFAVSSNCPVNITVEGEPLTYGGYVIQTRIDLRTPSNGHIAHSGIDLGPKIGNPGALWGKSTTLRLQDIGLFNYRVRVLAWLGDIHDQAAGDYSGQVVLTLSAAD